MWHEVGVITLKNKEIDVSDPGFHETFMFGRVNAIPAKPGTWRCMACVYKDPEYPEFGTRVWANRLIHESVADEVLDLEGIGVIGVDAGMAGYFLNGHEMTDYGSFVDEVIAKRKSPANELDRYSIICKEGFFTDSGTGDGSYPVYAQFDESGNAVAFEIAFD